MEFNIANFFANFLEYPNSLNFFLEAAIIAIITIIVAYQFNKLLDRYEKRHTSNKIGWDSSIILSLRQPMLLFIWVNGLTYSFEILNILLNFKTLSFLPTLRTIATITAIFGYLTKLVKGLESKWAASLHHKTSKLDATTISAIIKLLKVILFIVAGLIILETLGFSISGILAFGGIGGAGVTLAAKDLLASFFGALMIYLDKPFKEGDYIKIESKGVEGNIEKIGLRCTVVRNLDKSPIYIPNSIFTTTTIENPSRMSHKRIHETIILRHEDIQAVDKIIKDINAYLKQHKKIDQNLDIVILLKEVNYLGLCVEVNAYINSTNALVIAEIKTALMIKIGKIVANYNAKFAYKDAPLAKTGIAVCDSAAGTE